MVSGMLFSINHHKKRIAMEADVVFSFQRLWTKWIVPNNSNSSSRINILLFVPKGACKLYHIYHDMYIYIYISYPTTSHSQNWDIQICWPFVSITSWCFQWICVRKWPSTTSVAPKKSPVQRTRRTCATLDVWCAAVKMVGPWWGRWWMSHSMIQWCHGIQGRKMK